MSLKPENQGTDLVMWIGTKYYPTINSFVRESRALGVCKRLPQLIRSIEPKRTRVFLVHDEGIKGEGTIFGYFIVKRVEIVVSALENLEEIPENTYEHVEKGLIVPVECIDEPIRKCGWRAPGGVYIVSETNIERLRRIAEKIGAGAYKGGLFLLSPKLRYDYFFESAPIKQRFRGTLQILRRVGNSIVKCKDKEAIAAWQPRVHRVKGQVKWTGAEDLLLLRMVGERTGSKSQAFTEFARLTGYSKISINYRYHLLIGRV